MTQKKSKLISKDFKEREKGNRNAREKIPNLESLFQLKVRSPSTFPFVFQSFQIIKNENGKGSPKIFCQKCLCKTLSRTFFLFLLACYFLRTSFFNIIFSHIFMIPLISLRYLIPPDSRFLFHSLHHTTACFFTAHFVMLY
jgi:hypothetical protein